MKRVFVILSAFATLVACSKVTPIVDDPMQEENQEIKVNFTISREDANTDTKASVKTAFSEDDVVFVFFNGVDAPKHLEMKRTGDSWTPITDGELKASDLVDGGTLTAIYLPYGSGITVDGSGNTFTFSESYTGYYYVASTTYGFENNTVTANITLAVAPPDSGSDVIVHFDVSGLSSTHEYNMYQEYVKPLTLTAISNTGTVDQTVGAAGDAILGHQDAGFVSFSGVLDASAVGKGNAKKYQFFVRDETLGTLYYRRTTASAKLIEVNTYIGLGSAATSPWAVASPGEFSVNASKTVQFSRSNLSYLGATGGEHPWQLMKYPWSVIETTSPFNRTSSVDFSLFGWATSGYNSKYPWFNSDQPVDYGPAISSGEFAPSWDWGQYNKGNIYEYGGDVALSGNWRVLSQPEWLYILGVTSTETNCGRNETNRFARCVVGGLYGVAIFPDDFVFPSGFPTVQEINKYASGQSATAAFEQNTFTSIQWNMLEAMGVAFLPCAGQGNPGSSTYASLTNYNTAVRIWTSTASNSEQAYAILIGNAAANALKTNNRHMAASVRLVHVQADGQLSELTENSESWD